MTVVGVTASRWPRCATSYRTALSPSSLSPPTGGASRAPTGTATSSTPWPSHRSMSTCSSSWVWFFFIYWTLWFHEFKIHFKMNHWNDVQKSICLILLLFINVFNLIYWISGYFCDDLFSHVFTITLPKIQYSEISCPLFAIKSPKWLTQIKKVTNSIFPDFVTHEKMAMWYRLVGYQW